MRIVEVRTAILTRTYDGSVRNTRHQWDSKSHLLVSVIAADGSFGIGESYCTSLGTARVIETMIRDELAPLIVGEDARLIAQLRRKMLDAGVLNGRRDGQGPALAGIDIALWDLFGKLAKQPLYRLLGGHSSSAPVYGSGGMYGPQMTLDRLGREMTDALSRGLGGVKIKGAGGPLVDDVRRVMAVREAIGPDVPLMVDAMFALDVPGATRLARALEPANLHFLEAPTGATDVGGWRSISAQTSIALAGPELEPNSDLMRRFIEADAVHFLQYDVTIAGGLTQGRDLAALAQFHHRPVTLHCSGSAIALAAALHLAAAVPNCDSVEFHLMHQLLHDQLWASGYSLGGGTIQLPDAPGLGIDADLDALARSCAELEPA